MKRILKIILTVVLLIIVILYVSSFDWNRAHSAYARSLPVFDSGSDVDIQRIKARNNEFVIRSAGMHNDGPGVILLHGFPESSIVWKPLLAAAAKEGYRAVAFDQRGYSPRARPVGIEHYHIDTLVQDVLDIADAVGFDTFHLVGHDWGSAVGWKTVMDRPDRVRSWTAMSIPHVGVFFESILNHPEQQKRSGYMKRLKQVIVPELAFRFFQKSIYEGLRDSWTSEQIAYSRSIFREKGGLTGPLNWYRALDYKDSRLLASLQKEITAPTLFIWGNKDPVIAHDVIPLQMDYIKGDYQEMELDGGHSLMQEKENEVIVAVLKHISSF